MENNTSNSNDSLKEKSKNFIYEIIDEDLKTNKWNGNVHTRFPPEPSGYLHIGHLKAVILNRYLADKHEGKMVLIFISVTQNLFVLIMVLLVIIKENSIFVSMIQIRPKKIRNMLIL